ncbi:MAG: branched-chain amino acid ABC transporter permease, partial [Deltaproteobacteria bacterium]|nr:branched-chain amino acid ABC transporter permease [Deltaproteobacteria bacterium]
LIYKSTSILNLAQGEFMMVGAYICLSMTLDFGLNFSASFIITMVFSILLGLVVERLVLRPLIGEPIISIIMVTLGLTYILRGVVIMFWGNDIRQFNIFPQQPLDFWGVKVTYLYLWSMGISLVLLTFFAVFFKYARLFCGFFQICPYRHFHAGRGRSSDRRPEHGNIGQTGVRPELVYCGGGLFHRRHPDRQYRRRRRRAQSYRA